MMLSKTFLATAFAGLSITQFVLAQDNFKEGKKLYTKYNCIACHGKDGKSPFNLTNSANSIHKDSLKNYIMNPGSFGNERMPAFEGIIKEEEYPSLIAYIQRLAKSKKG